jgi:hypothetical protein
MNVMKKLNQTQQLKVETAKEAISKLQEAEAIIYSKLIEEVDLDNDWLYDYVFNCATEDDYSAMVRREIFE